MWSISLVSLQLSSNHTRLHVGPPLLYLVALRSVNQLAARIIRILDPTMAALSWRPSPLSALLIFRKAQLFKQCAAVGNPPLQNLHL